MTVIFPLPCFINEQSPLRTIGKAGEEIAYIFEKERLSVASNTEIFIDLVFEKNARAGFDIFSRSGKDNRFIEVKTSSGTDNPFYLTANEFKVLKSLNTEAYLYLVHVEDVVTKKGQIVEVISEPMNTTTAASLTPVLYKVTKVGKAESR